MAHAVSGSRNHATSGRTIPVMEPSKGRSGIGLLAFAILAIVLIVVVAVVAFGFGQQVAAAQRSLSLLK
jgi:hypothetical protein